MARKSSSVSPIVAAIIVDGAVLPFAVVAKTSKWRGGRHWEPGVHVFDTEEKRAELGTADQVAALLSAIEGDPLGFEIKAAGLEKE